MLFPKEYIEKADFDKGFGEYYKRNILPLSVSIEAKRKKYLSIIKVGRYLMFILPILTIAAFFIWPDLVPRGTHRRGSLHIILVMLASLIGYSAMLFARLKYENYFRRQVNPKLLSFLTPSLKYDADKKIENRLLKEMGVFTRIFSKYSMGSIHGNYNGNHIVAEYAKVDMGGYYSYSFEGLIIDMSNVKDLNGRFLIKPSDFIFDFRDKRVIRRRLGLNSFKLKDILLFENALLYSDSEDSVRRAFPTELQHKLIELKSRYGYQTMRVSYANGEMLLLLPCQKNILEGRLVDKEEITSDDWRAMIKDIKDMFDVANEINNSIK